MPFDEKDVDVGWIGSSSTSVPGNFDRKLKVTGRTVTARHKPSGLSMTYTIGPGRFSKTEMQRETDKAVARLISDLKMAVEQWRD